VFFDAESAARDGVSYRNTDAWFLTLRDNRIVFGGIAFNDLSRRVRPETQS
jgi:ketosteroid isomerase-like protein